jgi:hypothetical protein
VSRKASESRRRPAKPRTREQSDQATLPLQPPDQAMLLLLPMEIQIGDRFTDQDLEWDVVNHPAILHGGKSLRARIQRPGLPESEREITWAAHERVNIRRSPKP